MLTLLLYTYKVALFLAPNIHFFKSNIINASFATVLELSQSVPKITSIAPAHLILSSLFSDRQGKESSNVPRNRHL